MDHHHRLAAQAGRRRFADTQRERRGYRGVDRVSSRFQYLNTGLSRTMVGGCHHAPMGLSDPLSKSKVPIAQLKLFCVGNRRTVDHGYFPR